MKSLSIIIKNIINLLPYLIVIAIYFFFVNLEARKDRVNNLNSNKEKILTDNVSSSYDEKVKINIPVIPYDN